MLAGGTREGCIPGVRHLSNIQAICEAAGGEWISADVNRDICPTIAGGRTKELRDEKSDSVVL